MRDGSRNRPCHALRDAGEGADLACPPSPADLGDRLGERLVKLGRGSAMSASITSRSSACADIRRVPGGPREDPPPRRAPWRRPSRAREEVHLLPSKVAPATAASSRASARPRRAIGGRAHGRPQRACGDLGRGQGGAPLPGGDVAGPQAVEERVHLGPRRTQPDTSTGARHPRARRRRDASVAEPLISWCGGTRSPPLAVYYLYWQTQPEDGMMRERKPLIQAVSVPCSVRINPHFPGRSCTDVTQAGAEVPCRPPQTTAVPIYRHASPEVSAMRRAMPTPQDPHTAQSAGATACTGHQSEA